VQINLTEGNLLKVLARFSVPFLISSFLQTFYGLADLFIAGQFNGADVITAVSVGSQLTHMLTVIIVGLTMGSTVFIGKAVGEKDTKRLEYGIGNIIVLFAGFAVMATAALLIFTGGIVKIMETPAEAVLQTKYYLAICFAGVPFITAYNVIASIFRGLGDSKSPMYFVIIAGVINVLLDILFIGPMDMKAAGAALATIIAQAISVLAGVISLVRKNRGFRLRRDNFRLNRRIFSDVIRVGVPVSLQDGLIQVSFLVITVIANSRGIMTAAAVGIVEKIISFLFLVPSAMLSSISAIAAQNAGAGRHERSRKSLRYGITITVLFGLAAAGFCQIFAEQTVALFSSAEPQVIILGGQYLRAYALDCIFAGVHFCFSGYFCAYNKAAYSFVHNVASMILIRIPGAYIASLMFPDTLYPMGLAAPAGSLLSVVICTVLYIMLQKKQVENKAL
jgi:putative MATE family efflux protein